MIREKVQINPQEWPEGTKFEQDVNGKIEITLPQPVKMQRRNRRARNISDVKEGVSQQSSAAFSGEYKRALAKKNVFGPVKTDKNLTHADQGRIRRKKERRHQRRIKQQAGTHT